MTLDTPAGKPSIQLPFAEQSAFFRQKLRLPTEKFSDIEAREHDRAFIVAGATKADLLLDLQRAIQKAIDKGSTLETFRKDFDQIVAKHGWTGWTGEDSKEGRAWRTKVIYETNLTTSHAAGRYQQMRDPDVLRDRPYWRYIHRSRENPRLQHLAWNGLVLPADDPWWSSHYPPCGFGCKCTVESLSQADLEALGMSKPNTAPPIEYESAKVDGKIVSVPKGVGFGWDHAPGSNWHPDLNKYPYDLARQVVSENMEQGVFDRWLNRIGEQVDDELKKPDYAGLGKDQIVKKLRVLDAGEQYPVAVIPQRFQEALGVTTQVVVMSEYDAIKQAFSRAGDKNFGFDAYRDVQHILDNPNYIVREQSEGNTQMTVWLQQGGKSYMAVLQQTKTGKGLFLKSFRLAGSGEREFKRAMNQGKGVLLYEKSKED